MNAKRLLEFVERNEKEIKRQELQYENDHQAALNRFQQEITSVRSDLSQQIEVWKQQCQEKSDLTYQWMSKHQSLESQVNLQILELQQK